ncbi:MAG: helix-turn-helix domain-containing protein [Bacteroidaceae bacterium]|nr:helix-turn-helix domain-containing protein [Bacteroidaceae bacterium]
MSKRNYKKHGYADLLKYMRLLDEGKSFYAIHVEYGIDAKQLKVLRAKYQKYGKAGLKKGKNIKADFALKKKIVLDIEENHLTLHAASLKYGASPQGITAWLSMYRKYGWQALEKIKRRGRPPGMGSPKKNSKPLTELERLRKEVQELKTENALLKKVRALVEERNARLREIGRGPSKD